MSVENGSKKTGRKHDLGKPDFSLVPPNAELEVIRVLTYGAAKYDRDNWKLVDSAADRYFAAARRHMSAVRRGESYDEETGVHHYAHAICSLLFLLELELEKDN